MQSRALLLFLPLSLTSCAKNPDSTLEQAGKTITSWSATLDLASADLAAGHVTETYFRQVLNAAREELQQQRKSLDQIPESHPGHPPLEARFRALERRLASLSSQHPAADGAFSLQLTSPLPPSPRTRGEGRGEGSPFILPRPSGGSS